MNILDEKLNNESIAAQFEALGFKPHDGTGLTIREALFYRQIAKGINGDIKAFEAVVSASPEEKMPLEDFVLSNLKG